VAFIFATSHCSSATMAYKPPDLSNYVWYFFFQADQAEQYRPAIDYSSNYSLSLSSSSRTRLGSLTIMP
jgi:hypothetical protein